MKTLSEIPSFLPNHYKGKVRDTFDLGDGRMVFVTSDRLSAFDRAITAVPNKGAILNGIAQFWFDQTKHILPNHVISIPDPNVMIVKKLNMLPVEVVVRRYMTGTTGTSIWTKYRNGEREMYGHSFPEGMVKNQELPETILTPTTKGKTDDPISGEEIVKTGLVSKELWAQTEKAALTLFARGQEIAAKQGLILVDTKYEFGTDENGVLHLADEIHTPDSSRYWVAATYQERFDNGAEPEGLDKEFVRKWLVERMEDAYTSPLPEITDADNEMFSRKYAELYQRVTGGEFKAEDTDIPVMERIQKNLKEKAAV
ncbi:MAG: phosphoribosylaminoimidazolesuccinocarboxamide synthase [Micavibrio aeruginosavorus]|uniref:Phosphoribosylaminoimidazole-succinocarboxamide synthase n=1 Tax=Micavibrio aeruginosavorus TaxID=349221 RepID=A0A2W5HTB3_9BACT|nr:MAG: phosphoribosylaminoimidazolesuccinocarboxamide synthase [Micavibrio aeruginosavorus]